LENLTEEDQQIIKEELISLQKLQMASVPVENEEFRELLLEQITDLTESIPDIKDADLSQVDQQLRSLATIVNRVDPETSIFSFHNPYFAHIKLREEKVLRDLYIGTKLFRTPDRSIQVIDWKTAPIAIIYFLYDEGDDYEEEIEGRMFEGIVEQKRILKVLNGELIRIQQGNRLLLKNRDLGWQKQINEQFLVRGTQSAAGQQRLLTAAEAKLGVGTEGQIQENKQLQEITGLIDSDQYRLITQPESSIIAIQGTAGTGKTTVALHRVAWLHFQDQQRFAADRLLVTVFNKALANYISKVLPDLDVHDVQIEIFEEWMSQIRFRLFGNRLPKTYSDDTPVSVIRFKKHPALLQIMNDFIEEKKAGFNQRLNEILENKGIQDFPLDTLNTMSFINQLYSLYKWVEGESELSGLQFNYGIEVGSLINKLLSNEFEPDKPKIQTLIYFWEELFTNFKFLRSKFSETVNTHFSDEMLDEAIDWQRRQYIARLGYESIEKPDLNFMVTGKIKLSRGEATLDFEDDPIFLYFYQKLFDDIPSLGGTKLKFAHLMVDEVQDLSPIDLNVLFQVVDTPPSITLAGDVHQKMVEYSGFHNWETMFENVGLDGHPVSSLKVGYRSTYEIMSFSQSVLGDLLEDANTAPTRSGMPVELFQFSNQGELVYFLSKNLRELIRKEPNASVAVICFNPQEANNYYDLLAKTETPELRLVADQDFLFAPGIEVTDIKQVKGLEFDYVILLDVDTLNYPTNNYSRYLLHIGASRAAHQLWLMNYREPASILPKKTLDNIIY
jgi:DNA helicase II / ATP-dependent DNA helicase PcrA